MVYTPPNPEAVNIELSLYTPLVSTSVNIDLAQPNFIFQERATGNRINISESILKDFKNTSTSVKFRCKYTGEILVESTAWYMDKDENILVNGKIKIAREITKNPSNEDRIYEIEIYDSGYSLIEGNLNQIFRNKKPEEIIEEVVEAAGLIFVNQLATATDYLIDKKVYLDVKPIEAIEELIDTLGASWTVRGETFYLYRTGSASSILDIDENGSWYISEKGWETDTDKLAKTVIVRGAKILQRTTEQLSGTGTEFTVSWIPEDIEVLSPTGLIQTTSQIEGDFTVDKQNKKITFNDSQTDPEVSYSYYSQLRVQVGNAEPIRILEKKYVESKTEARRFGRRYLEVYGDGVTHSEWASSDIYGINYLSMRVGDLITVTNKMNIPKNGQYIIESIQREYPRRIRVNVGEDVLSLYDWQKEAKDRIKQLESDDQNADFVSLDEFLVGNVRVVVESEVTHLFEVRETGEILFASEDALENSSDWIYDDGSEPEAYPLAVDDDGLSAFPNSYTDYLD